MGEVREASPPEDGVLGWRRALALLLELLCVLELWL